MQIPAIIGKCRTAVRRTVYYCFPLLILASVGCGASGPLSPLASWNPYLRKQWDEDEQYMTTMHRKLAQVREIERVGDNLSQAEQQKYSAILLPLVNDDNSVLRAAVTRALGKLRVADAMAGLRQAAVDDVGDVRVAACVALGSIGGPEAIQLLSERIRTDKSRDVQLAATRALGNFRDRAAIEALAAVLDNNDPALQFRATESLRKASGEDFGNNVPAWREYLAGRQPNYQGPSIGRRLIDAVYH